MDDAIAREGMPPGREHGARNLVAVFQRMISEGQDRLAIEPRHGQQSLRAQFRHGRRHDDARIRLENEIVKPHMRRLALIIEFLAQSVGQFLIDFPRVDRTVHAAKDLQQHTQLAEIGLHRGLHVRILQLGNDFAPVRRHCAMHLAQRRRKRRIALERLEMRLPVGAEFGTHAALYEGPAHGRGGGLELRQFFGKFFRHGFGNGGQKLGDLHDRPLHAAQRLAQLARRTLVEPVTEKPVADEPRGNAAHAAADLRITLQPPPEAIAFRIPCRAVSVAGRPIRHQSVSSSSMKRSITESPCCQKAGSLASRPKGARSSLWRSVPPAASICI